MSRSSESDTRIPRIRRPGLLERAQVEPTAALVATVVVCLGVSLYAVALDGSITHSDRDLAPPTLERVHAALEVGGVVAPGRIDRALRAGPTAYHLNVTLRTPENHWTAGPQASDTADTATRRVGVELGPGRVRPGTLRVEVWS